MVVKDQLRCPGRSHRPCQRCHYRLVVWKVSLRLQLLLSDFLGTNEDRTDPFLPHAHPIRSDKFSQWSQFKQWRGWWSLKVASVETRRLMAGHWLHASHVVRRLIKMIGHCAPGQYWQWDSTELVSTIINWKLFSNLHFLSDAPRINQNSNK